MKHLGTVSQKGAIGVEVKAAKAAKNLVFWNNRQKLVHNKIVAILATPALKVAF